jgi:hypothetical protein
MSLLFVFLISSVLAFAQPSFSPVELSDEPVASFFYPMIYDSEDGNVLVTWALETDSYVGTYGQRVGTTGALIGEAIIYQELSEGDYLCPPHLTLVPTADGGRVQLILHN